MLLVVTVLSLIIAAVTFALEIVGLTLLTSVGVIMVKVTFYVSIGLFVALVIISICCMCEEEMLWWFLEAALAIALVVVGGISLIGGRLSLQDFYVSGQYGVVYAETNTEYTVWKVQDKKEDVYIQTTINDKSVTNIKSSAAKGNQTIKTLTFAQGDLTIDLNAFKDCGRLASVTFDSNSEYYCSDSSFAGCSSLKEFNVDGAKVHGVGFPDSSKITVNVDGGYLAAKSLIDTLVCENKSSFSLNSTAPKTLVFKDGFNFSDGEYVCYQTSGFFTKKTEYYSAGQVIYIPQSVTNIPNNFFGDFGDGCKVHYAGTQEQWNSLTISSTGNSNYTNGKVKIEYSSSYGG